MKDAKKYGAIYCMTCRIGWESSKRIWSIKVVLQSDGETLRLRIKTLPVLLTNYQWSREQSGTGLWQAQYLHSLPERPKLRHLLEDENDEVFLQKTCWNSRGQSGTLWWFNNCGLQNSQWRKWITQQSSICRGGTRVDNTVVTILPVQNKNFSGVPEEPKMKFLEPTRKPKVIHTDNSLEFGKSCEDLHWNHCTSTPHRPETNGIAETGALKEGTSSVLLQSGLNENWWSDSMECYCYLRNTRSLVWWDDTSRKAIRRTIQRINNSVWFENQISPYFCQRPVATASGRHEGIARYILWICAVRGENLERRPYGRQTFEELEKMDASQIHAINAHEVLTPINGENFTFRSQMDQSNYLEGIRFWEHPP